MIARPSKNWRMTLKGRSKEVRWKLRTISALPRTMASVLSRLFFFFKDGQVVDQVVGAVPKKGIAEKLNALLQTG